MKHKIIIILFTLILLIMNINIVNALNPSVINIENIEKEFKFEYTNLSYVNIKTLDSSDKITKIEINLKDKDINSGIMLNFSGNVSYTALTSKYYYLGFIPYKNVTHFMTYQNYTIFKESKNYNTLLSFDSKIIIEYNINNGNTSFQFSPNANIIDILKYYTNGYTGLPTDNFILKSINKVDMIITVKDVNEILFIKYKKESLSPISQTIYGILTLNSTFGENDILLNILSILDILFTIITFIIVIIFIYPYLILIWIITIGNIYSAFHSNTLKKFILYIRAYYAFVFEGFMKILSKLIELLIQLISVIRQMVQL